MAKEIHNQQKKNNIPTCVDFEQQMVGDNRASFSYELLYLHPNIVISNTAA